MDGEGRGMEVGLSSAVVTADRSFAGARPWRGELTRRAFLLLLSVLANCLWLGASTAVHVSADGRCGPGQIYDRGVIGCIQEFCPEGAGRLYSGSCSCWTAEWGGEPKVTCSDSQSGLVTHCLPEGGICEGSSQSFDPFTGMLLEHGVSTAVDPGYSARVVALEGEVEYINEKGESFLVEPGMVVPGSFRVYTSAASRVTLRMPDGHTVELQELTEVTVGLLTDPETEVKTRLWLRAGEVTGELGHARSVRSDFRVRTPTATLGVRGTVFRVRVDQDGSTFQVAEGEILVTPSNPSFPPFELMEGEQVKVSDAAVGAVEPFLEQITIDGSADAFAPFTGGGGERSRLILAVAVVATGAALLGLVFRRRAP